MLICFTLLLTAIPVTAIRIAENKRKSMEAKEKLMDQKLSTDPIANKWIFIPPGEFIMGSDEGSFDEKPVRKVRLGEYSIQEYEVTFHDYMEFVEATSHRSPLTVRDNATRPHFDNPNKPAVYVSWDDAVAYCAWIGARLPTEAEWEKAARGIFGRSWPWGNRLEPSHANFIGGEDNYLFTAPVGSFKHDKSPFGVYDMGGNAREWVSDWYGERYYQSAPQNNPEGPKEGKTRTLRGGSWNDSAISSRTSARLKMFPHYRDVSIGFRCVKESKEGLANRGREKRQSED